MGDQFYFANTLEEFENHLKKHSMETASKFVVIGCEGKFKSDKVTPCANQMVHWKHGDPYFRFAKKVYQCEHGKDFNLYQKRKHAEKRNKAALMDDSILERCWKIQRTKKLGCSAMISVIRVIWMPKYKLTGAFSPRYNRTRTLKNIRERLKNGESVGHDGYLYNLPRIADHTNHYVGGSDPTLNIVYSQLQPNVVEEEDYHRNGENENEEDDNEMDYNEEIIKNELNSEESPENVEEASDHQELPGNDSERVQIMNECNSSLSAIMQNMSDSELKKLNFNLKRLVSLSNVSVGENSVESSSPNRQIEKKDIVKIFVIK